MPARGVLVLPQAWILITVQIFSIDAALDMGATLLSDGRGCSFKVWAPHASEMRVEVKPGAAAIATEEHTIVLQRGDGDMWYGECDRAHAGCDYRIALESSWNDCYSTEGATLYRRDPYARYAPDPDGAFSRLDDRGAGFPWSCDKHPMLLSGGLVGHSIYELHVGTFSPEGTFRGAAERLEHVAELGFTVAAPSALPASLPSPPRHCHREMVKGWPETAAGALAQCLPPRLRTDLAVDSEEDTDARSDRKA